MWNYTVRQARAYAFLAYRRKAHESARTLSIGTSAARGAIKTVQKTVKEWNEE